MHTPGPWTVDSDDGIDFTILGGKTSQVCIAVETSERDARLIASAPDLLAALQSLVEEYEPNLKAFALNAPRRAKWERASAAIARATGK